MLLEAPEIFSEQNIVNKSNRTEGHKFYTQCIIPNVVRLQDQ